MKYIIITIVAISVNALILFMLGNKVLGVGLRLKSLMMCGFCAIFLSLVLPRVIVNFTSLADTIGFFSIIAIILAGFVAYYDDMKETSSASSLSSAMEIEQRSLPKLGYFGENTFGDKRTKVNIEKMRVGLEAENVESTGQLLIDSTADQVNEFRTSETFVASECQLNLELQLEPIAATNQFGESSISKVVAENVETLISPRVMNGEMDQIPTSEEDSMLISKPEVMLYNKVLAPDDSKVIDLVESTKDQSELGPASDSLDDMLECAFSYKEHGQDSSALTTFKCAFELHRDKKIAPFLVIEIANLLKNRGAYDEAIAILTENRNLTGIHENHGLDQDFVNTIAYLRIIKNTLLENHFGYIPIGKIPAEILKKIDDEFHEWRNFL